MNMKVPEGLNGKSLKVIVFFCEKEETWREAFMIRHFRFLVFFRIRPDIKSWSIHP